jgi:hypothetical protein
MSQWKNEDDIKDELRTLTKGLKELREELRAMVAPQKQNPSRAFLHRQARGPLAEPVVLESAPERGLAADNPPPRRRTRRPRSK